MNLDELRAFIAEYNPQEIKNKAVYKASGTFSLGDINFSDMIPRRINGFPNNSDKSTDLLVWRHSRYERHTFHTHEYIEIMYMYIGNGINITEYESIELHEGDLCVITPGAMHLPYISGDSVLMNLLVKPSYLNELIQRIKSDGEIADYFRSIFRNRHLKFLHIHSSEDKNAVELASRLLLSFFDADWADSDFEQKCRFELLLLYLMKSCSSRTTHSSKQFICGKLFENIHDIIVADYRVITLDTLADKLGYSKAHICRVIKSASGTTFSDYVNRIKIVEACRLLKTSKLSILEISNICGFSNIEYFYRIFKRQMSQTPSEYRNKKVTD